MQPAVHTGILKHWASVGVPKTVSGKLTVEETLISMRNELDF